MGLFFIIGLPNVTFCAFGSFCTTRLSEWSKWRMPIGSQALIYGFTHTVAQCTAWRVMSGRWGLDNPVVAKSLLRDMIIVAIVVGATITLERERKKRVFAATYH